jgi:thymidylate synthase (FAD)
MVVDAARVSFDKKSEWANAERMLDYPDIRPELSEKDRRLIRFLARHGHTSPFNHTFITMHVSAPVFVARQLVKHKFMPWNEVSGRYVTFKPEFHMPAGFRAKAEDKKQGSGDNLKGQPETDLQLIFLDHHKDSFERYIQALNLGLCEEQARGLLPLNLMTQWYWSGTLGAWASMYNLRAKPDAQQETQEIAYQAGDIIKPLFPCAWEALTDD